MTRCLRLLPTLMLTALLFPGAAVAADRGKVAFLEGTLTVNGKPAVQGTPVREGDRLKTGQGSRADVVMESDVRMRLFGKTDLVIPAESRRNPVRLLAGRLLSIVTGRPYSVQGDTAVAGVRGTTFYVASEAGERTYICICNGELDIHDPTGREKIAQVAAEHHRGFRIGAAPEDAPMLGHTDDDIAELRAR